MTLIAGRLQKHTNLLDDLELIWCLFDGYMVPKFIFFGHIHILPHLVCACTIHLALIFLTPDSYNLDFTFLNNFDPINY